MAASSAWAFFNQWRTWRYLEWLCLVAAVLAIVLLFFLKPSHALATLSALFTFIGSVWLATGVYQSGEQVRALHKRKNGEAVAEAITDASNRVWLAVLYFALATAAQIASLFV